MMDSIYIGSTPWDEPCAQVGEPGYAEKAMDECNRFIALLRKKFGPEPEGARLFIKRNLHDFGTYLSVECKYEVGNEAAEKYAYRCESETPATWDD
ncbi:MAG: hypothetical protein BV459_01490 [Thermoplasmata archaeon M11B2D]|nr:MAG: hypothetical protein BV459_01490 [Thermoplasmata archaeon M11B2D]